MPATFHNADESVYAMLAELIDTYRDDLKAARAKITLLFAVSTNEKPAMTHHGFKVLGRVQINSLQDRAEGKGDATIVFDGDRWPELSESRQKALMHHELSHIARWGKKNDAIGRPKLALRPGDWQNDGFNQVVAIYGDDAPERRWLNAVEESLRQQRLFDGDAA